MLWDDFPATFKSEEDLLRAGMQGPMGNRQLFREAKAGLCLTESRPSRRESQQFRTPEGRSSH